LREAGVDDVLLVAGSNSPPAGPFENTLQVLETGAFERAGIARLGVAGHPEGHPRAGIDELDSALAEKNAIARHSGIEVYVVTQFFFDAAPVIAWEERIRTAGNRLAVHPGLHGVTGVTRLARYGLSCGIGASLDVLRQRASSLLGLVGAQAPDMLALDLARVCVTDPKTLLSSFHMFPLGGLDSTIRWINAMREGRFDLSAGGTLKVHLTQARF
jgi:methylenetetrahydrofolate reductase (NADPH)